MLKRVISFLLALVLCLGLTSFAWAEGDPENCPDEQHQWGTGTITPAATCKAKGIRTYTCASCGKTKTEDIEIDSNAHSWDNGKVTTAATCKDPGVKTYTCSACNETKTESIPKLTTHTWDTWSSDADKHSRNCTVCGTPESAAHTWGAWTYDETQHSRKCTVCGYSSAKENHKFTTDKWEKDTSSHWQICTVCGGKGKVEAHKWDSGKVTTAATCVKKGVKTYTCTVCKTTKTESLGYGSHIWGDGSVEKDATITEPGTLVRKCDVCGKVRSEVISRLGLRMTPEELTAVVAEENNVLRIRLDDELYVIMQGVFTPEETECLQDGWPAEITLKAVDVTMDVPDQTLDELMERRDNLLSCFHLQLSKSVHTSADEVSETESLSTPANPLIMALDFPETMPQPDGKKERHYFLYSLEGDSTEKVAFQLKEDGSGIRFQTDKMDGTFILLFRDGNGGSFNPMVLVFGLVGLTALGGIGFLVKKVFFTYEEE